METFGKLPDDNFYENINSYLKMWLYHTWIDKIEQENELLKNQAILIGSFFNPEMAQKIIKQEKPDYQSTNIDDTTKLVRQAILEDMKPVKKRHKKRKVKMVK